MHGMLAGPYPAVMLVLVFAITLLFLRWDRRSPSVLGLDFSWRRGKEFIAGFAGGGFLVGAMAVGIWLFLPFPWAFNPRFDIGVAAYSLLFLCCSNAGEELVFRGYSCERLISAIGIWKAQRAGCVDHGLFRAASEGVPQGGVISPLLSNIMLHEFDAWMEMNYLNKKVRKDRWAWNFGILNRRPIAVRENRQWIPAISYCRYADDFVVIVKGTKAHAEAVREACRGFLEGQLKLTLNMEKTHVTHVNDGFVFLGHRIVRKRGPRGRMRPVSTIPWEKYRRFAEKLVKQLSGDYVQTGWMSWKA